VCLKAEDRRGNIAGVEARCTVKAADHARLETTRGKVRLKLRCERTMRRKREAVRQSPRKDASLGVEPGEVEGQWGYDADPKPWARQRDQTAGDDLIKECPKLGEGKKNNVRAGGLASPIEFVSRCYEDGLDRFGEGG
jgi:hypothetical protein